MKPQTKRNVQSPKSRRISLVISAILCLFLLIGTLGCLVSCDEEEGDGGQAPIYLGMTASNDLPLPGQTYDDLASPSYRYEVDADKDVYITVFLSNPDELEIFSVVINDTEYYPNNFEVISDTQMLILKQKVAAPMQEDFTYTISAIEIATKNGRIVQPRWEGKTSIYVSDVNSNEGTGEDNNDENNNDENANDGHGSSEGLEIVDGRIVGIGTCTESSLYLNLPVEANAFADCLTITEVRMGPGVTSVGDHAFEFCTGLKKVTLSDTLTSLREFAFNGCISLESIAFPASLHTIELAAFQNCRSLVSVTFSEGLKQIGNYAFCECSKLESVTLPNTLIQIADGAFLRCSSLATVTFSQNLQSIGENAFDECTALTSVTLPDCLTSLGPAAFARCSSLTSVTLPKNLKTIEKNAFLTAQPLPALRSPNI